jgi:hypothetical protein
MSIRISLVGAIAVVATMAAARPQKPATAASPCAADSSYQRLSFWIGDWDVFDSTGTHYATQRVTPVLDACAVMAEWASNAGDKGIGLSAFDPKTREWKQVYTSNQLPVPSSVKLRTSDPSYDGPGLRFIPVLDPKGDTIARTRITILPLSGHRALQMFEDSRDAGRTWHLAFKAEHRLH